MWAQFYEAAMSKARDSWFALSLTCIDACFVALSGGKHDVRVGLGVVNPARGDKMVTQETEVVEQERNRFALNVAHRHRTGTFLMEFAPWDGNTITIDFHDGLYNNAGRIVFDAGTTAVSLNTLEPYRDQLADPAELTSYFLSILQPFINCYTFGWSPEKAEIITYDQTYHANFMKGKPEEVEIKKVQAQIIRELANPERCLVAGSSNGELVRRCLEIGIDARGFDVIPNIEDIAFPEARGRLRRGSLTNIPYSAEDGFDTLVSVDVLEHVPERDVPAMVAEFARMGFRRLLFLINLNQFWFPGHITLRPLTWWSDQWAAHFRHVKTVQQFPHLPPVYSNDGRYNQQWALWETITR